MREIKFRVWHKIEKRWINLNGVSIEFNGCTNPGNVYSITEQGVLHEIDIKDVELMQFTGLKDKNGKEIYEGDILYHDRHDKKTIMKWVDDYACFASETIDEVVNGEFNYYQRIDEKSLEVIGNIYENPELI
jgi:uncharacterized phage protein (TIGR01671 family)